MSTFLPDQTGQRMAPHTYPPDADRKLVLVVDDEPAIAAMMRFVLEHHGYAVLTAGGGADALARHADRAGDLDLLVTDVLMPGMSGPQLAARLHDRRPDLPVLFVSGYTGDHAADLAAGAAAFLAKPFRVADLLAAVRGLLAPAAAAV